VTTELRFRAYLMRNRIAGWSTCVKSIAGCPDFFFPKRRLAVFIDGCFWHGCPNCGHTPKTNRSYWITKLRRNKRRDLRITKTLKSEGIQVLRLWECQLRRRPEWCVMKLTRALYL